MGTRTTSRSNAKLTARKTAGIVLPGGLPWAQCQLPPSSAPTIERRQTLILSGVRAFLSALAMRTIGAGSPSKRTQVLMAPS